MTQHILKTHTVDDSFVSSADEEECPHCGQSFFTDHKFALHLYTEQFISFDCEHCGKHLPGDDPYLDLHMKMCETPCSGDPHCPCQFYT